MFPVRIKEGNGFVDYGMCVLTGKEYHLFLFFFHLFLLAGG